MFLVLVAGSIVGRGRTPMFKRTWFISFLVAAVAGAGTARAGYLDENPDEVFEGVYKKLGVTLPLRAARDPVVWLRLEELKRVTATQNSINHLESTFESSGHRPKACQG